MTRSLKLSQFLALLLVLSGLPTVAEAQTGTLFVEADKVGIGIESPTHTLAITQVNAAIDVLDLNAEEGARTMLRLTNNGRINFNLFDSGHNVNWQFSNTLVGFQINQTTSPGLELRVTDAGDLFLEGQLFAPSSRAGKSAILAVDGREVLDKVIALPVATWVYEDQAGIRHIGPMAEDFYSHFGVGHGSRTLSPFDVGGVALAAIQGIGEELESKNREISDLRQQLDRESGRVEALERRLAEVERLLRTAAEQD